MLGGCGRDAEGVLAVRAGRGDIDFVAEKSEGWREGMKVDKGERKDVDCLPQASC